MSRSCITQYQWFIKQHNNFRTITHMMMKLGGRCTVHCMKISPELEFEGDSPLGPHRPPQSLVVER